MTEDEELTGRFIRATVAFKKEFGTDGKFLLVALRGEHCQLAGNGCVHQAGELVEAAQDAVAQMKGAEVVDEPKSADPSRN